jgi:hypothetical protein
MTWVWWALRVQLVIRYSILYSRASTIESIGRISIIAGVPRRCMKMDLQ